MLLMTLVLVISSFHIMAGGDLSQGPGPRSTPSKRQQLAGWGDGTIGKSIPEGQVSERTPASGLSRSNYVKSLYLLNLGGDQLLSIARGRAVQEHTVGPDQSVIFSLREPLRRDFIFAGTANLHVYMDPTVNAYISPAVQVRLESNYSFISSGTKTITEEGWYDFDLSNTVQVPEGDYLSLVIYVKPNVAGSNVKVKYGGNASSLDSSLTMATSTPIEVEQLHTMDSFGVDQTTFDFDDTLVVEARVSSTFGLDDVSVPKLSLTSPMGQPGDILDRVLMTIYSTAPSDGLKVFRHSRTLGDLHGGTYQIEVEAGDLGSQMVLASTNFTLPTTVSLSPEEITLQGEPGQKIIFEHEVTTLSSLDIINIQAHVSLPAGIWYYVQEEQVAFDPDGDGNLSDGWVNLTKDNDDDGYPDTGELQASETSPVALELEVPWCQALTQISLNVSFFGSLTRDTKTSFDTLLVEQKPDLSISPRDVTGFAPPGGSGFLEHTVVNEGNGRDTFEVKEVDIGMLRGYKLFTARNMTLLMENGTPARGFDPDNDTVCELPEMDMAEKLELRLEVFIGPEEPFDVFHPVEIIIASEFDPGVQDSTWDRIRVSRISLGSNKTELEAVPTEGVETYAWLLNHDDHGDYSYTFGIRANRTWSVSLFKDNGDGLFTSIDTLMAVGTGDDGQMGGGWEHVESDFNINGFPVLEGGGGENITLWMEIAVGPGANGTGGFEITVQSNYGDMVNITYLVGVIRSEIIQIEPAKQQVFAPLEGTALSSHVVSNVGNVEGVYNFYVKCPKKWAVNLYYDENDNAKFEPSDVLVATDSNSDGDFSDQEGDSLNTAFDSDGDGYPDLGLLGTSSHGRLFLQTILSGEGLEKGQRSVVGLFVYRHVGTPLANSTADIIIDTPPNIVVSESKMVKAGEALEIDASSTYDSDGDRLIFKWDFHDPYNENDVTFGPLGRHIYPVAGSYGAELTVFDGIANVTKTVAVTVTPPEAGLPVAKARINDGFREAVIKLGDWITLDASDSYDPDGGALTYQWTLALGNDDPLIYYGSSIALILEEPGSYEAVLKVYDMEGNADQDKVKLLVLDDLGINAGVRIMPSEVKILEDVTLEAVIEFDPPQTTYLDTIISWKISYRGEIVGEGQGASLELIPERAGIYLGQLNVTVNYGGFLCHISRSFSFTAHTFSNHPPQGKAELSNTLMNDSVYPRLLKLFDPEGEYDALTDMYIPVNLSSAGSYDPDGDLLDYEWHMRSLQFDYQDSISTDGSYKFPAKGPWSVSLELNDGMHRTWVNRTVYLVDDIPPVINARVVRQGKSIEIRDGSSLSVDPEVELDASETYDPDVRYGTKAASVLEFTWIVQDTYFKGRTIDVHLASRESNVTLVVRDSSHVSVMNFTLHWEPEMYFQVEREQWRKDAVSARDLGNVRLRVNAVNREGAVNVSVSEAQLQDHFMVEHEPRVVLSPGPNEINLSVSLMGPEPPVGVYNAVVWINSSSQQVRTDLQIFWQVHNISAEITRSRKEGHMNVWTVAIENEGSGPETVHLVAADGSGPEFFVRDSRGMDLGNTFSVERGGMDLEILAREPLDNLTFHYLTAESELRPFLNLGLAPAQVEDGNEVESRIELDGWLFIIGVAFFTVLTGAVVWRRRSAVRGGKTAEREKKDGANNSRQGAGDDEAAPNVRSGRGNGRRGPGRKRPGRGKVPGLSILIILAFLSTILAAGVETTGEATGHYAISMNGRERDNITITEGETLLLSAAASGDYENWQPYWLREDGGAHWGPEYVPELEAGTHNITLYLTDGFNMVKAGAVVRVEQGATGGLLYRIEDLSGKRLTDNENLDYRESNGTFSVRLTNQRKDTCMVAIQASSSQGSPLITCRCFTVPAGSESVQYVYLPLNVSDTGGREIDVSIWINVTWSQAQGPYQCSPLNITWDEEYGSTLTIEMEGQEKEGPRAAWQQVSEYRPLLLVLLCILVLAADVYYLLRPRLEAVDTMKTIRKARKERRERLEKERERIVPGLDISPEEVEVIEPDVEEESKGTTKSFNTMISLGDMDVIMPPKEKRSSGQHPPSTRVKKRRKKKRGEGK